MKRSTHLIPFSHDHQHALARALRLRRSGSVDAAARGALARSAVVFHDDVLGPHALEEEALMARALCRSQDSRLADANDRLLEEHALLQSRIEQLRGALAGGDVPGAASLQGLGAELAGHVRWEERTLFQLLQGLFGDGLADLVEVTDDAS